MTVADLYRYPVDRFGAASFVRSFGDRYEDKRQSRALKSRVQSMDYRPEDDPVRYMNDLLGDEALTPQKRQEAIETALPAIREKAADLRAARQIKSSEQESQREREAQLQRMREQLDVTKSEGALNRAHQARQDRQRNLETQDRLLNEQMRSLDATFKDMASNPVAYTPGERDQLKAARNATLEARDDIRKQLAAMYAENDAQQQQQAAMDARAPVPITERPSEEIFTEAMNDGAHDVALSAALDSAMITGQIAEGMLQQYAENSTKLKAKFPDDNKRKGLAKGAKGLIDNPTVSNVNKVKSNFETRGSNPADLGAFLYNEATYPGEIEIFNKQFPANAEASNWDNSVAATLKDMKSYRNFARSNVTPTKIRKEVELSSRIRSLGEDERFAFGDTENKTIFSSIYDKYFKNNFDGFAGAVSQLLQKNLGLPVTKAQILAQVNEALALEIDNDDAMMRLDQFYFLPLLENAFK